MKKAWLLGYEDASLPERIANLYLYNKRPLLAIAWMERVPDSRRSAAHDLRKAEILESIQMKNDAGSLANRLVQDQKLFRQLEPEMQRRTWQLIVRLSHESTEIQHLIHAIKPELGRDTAPNVRHLAELAARARKAGLVDEALLCYEAAMEAGDLAADHQLNYAYLLCKVNPEKATVLAEKLMLTMTPNKVMPLLSAIHSASLE